MADELIEVASEADQTSPAGVNKARLLSDNIKWTLSKALPKIYGDKLSVGGDGTPVKLETVIEQVIVRPKPPAVD